MTTHSCNIISPLDTTTQYNKCNVRQLIVCVRVPCIPNGPTVSPWLVCMAQATGI